MYIKLTFTVQAGRIGAEASAAIAELMQHPTVVKGLEAVPDVNEAIKGNQYINESVGSMFQDSSQSLKTYYVDCGEKSPEEIKKAIEIFHEHYETKQNGLPKVMWGGDSPDQNEIIRNMRAMLDNAALMLKMKPYESEFSLQSQVNEEQEEGFCHIL